jgi:hypothetical protein
MDKLLATLFLSRDVAHREHLKTTSYAHHMTLGSFYDDIIDLADSLAETYQGRHGVISAIPMLDDETTGPIDEQLSKHMDIIEKLRYTVIDQKDSPIQNIVDEIVALYLSTLYKLRNLK